MSFSCTPETEIIFGRIGSMGNHDSYLFLRELSQHPPFQTKLLHEVHSPFLSGKKREREKETEKVSCIRNTYRLTNSVIYVLIHILWNLSTPWEKGSENKEHIPVSPIIPDNIQSIPDTEPPDLQLTPDTWQNPTKTEELPSYAQTKSPTPELRAK